MNPDDDKNSLYDIHQSQSDCNNNNIQSNANLENLNVTTDIDKVEKIVQIPKTISIEKCDAQTSREPSVCDGATQYEKCDVEE